MKRVFGILAFMSFMCLLGSAGAVEQDMVTLGTGFVYMVLSLAAFAFFTWLAGGFDYSYTFDEDEESRPRCSRPKGGKRKRSL